jgi:DHA3 family tetracycline resistance protein-like MFS transporter
LNEGVQPYRLFVLICGTGAFAAGTAFTLNLVYQSQVVGLDPLQLVLVGTTMEVVCFVAQVPTGVIADLRSRRLSVILGYLLMGAGLLLWGLIPTYAGVLVANVIWAVGAVCVDGAQEAWAADEIAPELTGRAFVRAGQWGQAGTLLGIVAAVALSQVDLALPIIAGAVVTLALGVALIFLMPENGWSPTAVSTGWRSMRDQVVAGTGVVRRSGMLLAVVAATVFAGMSSEGFDRLSQPHFLADLRFPGTASPTLWFGAFAVVAATGSIVLLGLLGRHVHAAHPRRVGLLLAAVQAVTAAAVIGFGLTGSFWWATGIYLLATLLRESAQPILTVWLVSATSADSRATVFSLQAQADALGQIAGGPPAGLVGQRRGTGPGIATAGLFLLPAVALFLLAARRSPARLRPGPVCGPQRSTEVG